MELLPNNETDDPNEVHATTQDGRLIILYLTQENSKNWNIRDLPLEHVNIASDTGHVGTAFVYWLIGVGVTIALAMPEPFTKVVAAELIISGMLEGSQCFSVKRVSLEHPLAQGGTSYKVYETLDYSSHLGANINDRIEYAGAQYYFDWRFQTTTDDIFAIRVSATVEWWKWEDGVWMYTGESD